LATAATTRKTTARKAAAPRNPRATKTAAPANGSGNGKKAQKLVIVESPTKARTVQNILGHDYEVIASVGHVRDLPPAGFGGMKPKEKRFQPDYVVVKGKKDVIKDIASKAKDAERVFLSTDPDREGEAISWHIREAAGIPAEKTTRVVFHEITKPAIEAAFQEALSGTPLSTQDNRKPGELDMDLVDAQQARRILDRLMGYPLSWFVQDKVTRSASAGRVQSVALRLIVEREEQINNFRATEYWSIHALLAKEGRTFEAELARLPGMPRRLSMKPPFDEDRAPAIGSENDAQALIAAFNRSQFSVSKVDRGERKKGALPPFTTSTFQQAASNRMGLGAQRAMGIAQALYEGKDLPGQGSVGLITYIRTDSLNISPVARKEARDYIAGRWGADHIPAKENVYRAKTKGAQEAHEAIRPTDVRRTPDSLRNVLDRDELRVYQLIWQRFVASQMSDARFDTMSVEIQAKEGDELRGTFRASAQRLKFAGHLAVYGHHVDDSEDTPEEDGEAQLPDLAEGNELERRNVEGKQHFTEPPPRYTEASLVKKLEELGIGRPSTYASIVQTVQKREYVRREGRALVPQELGFLVNKLLSEYMGRYVNTGFTSEMEKELDEVAEGKRNYLSVVSAFWENFEPAYEKAKGEATKVDEPTEILCNVCKQANMVIKWGRNGKFFACPRYPECSNSLPMGPNGEPVFVAPPQVTEYRCPKCGGETIRKSGPYGPYLDCTNRENGSCDFRSGVPVGVECPEEPGNGQLVEKRTRRGIFYGCWNYPRCSYTTNSLEPEKMPPPRPEAEREAANAKLMERSARGKAAFAKRKTNAAARKAS
jgi:DNA topoisomerase-1